MYSIYTHLADSSLQHSIQPSLRCVHVPGDALAFDHTRELAHVSRHAQDVVEAVGRTTADLIVTGERQRQFLIAAFSDVDLQNNHRNKRMSEACLLFSVSRHSSSS